MRLAVFDVDGTVLQGNSWHVYFWWTLRRWPLQAPGLLARLSLRQARLVKPRALRESVLRTLVGCDKAAVEAIGRRVFEDRLQALVRTRARREIARFRAEGYLIILATGAFDFLVRPLATELGADEVRCTRLAYEHGICMGRIAGEEIRGVVKARAVRALFSGKTVDWTESWAFSDHAEDAPLLAMVGNPVFVGRRSARSKDLPPRVQTTVWDI